MEKRYERNFPSLTEEEWTLLRTKKAAVIGCGGLGGYLVEFLARIGIGTIRVVDGDALEETNLNRQLLALPSHLGTGKAEAAARRIRAIDLETAVEVYPVFLDAQNASRLIAGCDVVLDGLDNNPARKVLERACAEAQIPLIYGAVGGWIAQAAVILPGQRLIERLYPEKTAADKTSVLSFTPALCASVQAALCVRLLTGRPVEAGKVLYFDLLEEDFVPFPFE